MAISREAIIKRRKKIEAEKQKNELKLKEIQELLRKQEKEFLDLKKQEDQEKVEAIGRIILEKFSSDDSSFKELFNKEIAPLLSPKEKALFDLN